MQEARYKAFISYSHQDDKWAAWLHRSLEAYKPPKRLVGQETAHGPIPRRLAPVFRDRDELPTAIDLGSVINKALEQSACQIVVCSPAAARSKWVNEEILAFKRLGREDRIFCLIVGGEPNASDSASTADEECFPPALRYKLDARGELSDERTEPIAADARENKDGKSNAKLKLIAGMLAVGYDALRQRELHRRQRRLMAIAAASIAGMVVTSGLAVLAVVARAEADEQRVRAQEEAETAQQTTNFLVQLFKVSDPSESRGNTITAREILDRGARRIELELQDQPAIQSTLMDTMGTVYMSLGLYDNAKTLLERGLETRRSFYGDRSTQVASSESNVGQVLGLQADFEGAAARYEDAIQVLRTDPNADPAQLALALFGLADVQEKRGDVKSAEKLLHEAIDIQRPTSDTESLDLARSLDQLGMLLAGQARNDEAEDLLRESQAMRRHLLHGDVHPDIDESINNLAVFLYGLGEYEETERLFRESVDINLKLFGDDAPAPAVAMSNLAIVLYDTGQLAEAEKYAKRALDIRLKAFGEANPVTAYSLNSLAFIYYDEGKVDEALSLTSRALNALRSVYPGDHHDVAFGMKNLATLMAQQGDYAAAAPLLKEALEMIKRVMPSGHPDIAITEADMAYLLLETDKAEEAHKMAAAASQSLTASLGADYWGTAWASALEGASLAKLKHFKEAEPLLVQGYEGLKAAGGRKFQTATASRYLVELYSESGRPDMAAQYSEAGESRDEPDR